MTNPASPARNQPRTTRRSVAVVNGYVVPVAADPVENGTVLVEDGIITAVGADVVVPDGVPTLDARGRWVLPGFVEAHAHMGVMEEAEGWAGNDTNEMTDPNGAALRAIDAFKEFDKVFILTGGGPGIETELLSIYTYRMSFKHWDLGYGAACAFMVYLVVLIMCSVFYKAVFWNEGRAARRAA